MKSLHFAVAAALCAALVPAAATADDPNDPTMRSAQARARDRAIIRQLNLRELQHVRERDARYAEGWRAYRQQGRHGASYAADRENYDRAMDDYARQRADYERQRAAWRRAVAACNAGHYEYCDR